MLDSLSIDDPVVPISVHAPVALWGKTLAVGLFQQGQRACPSNYGHAFWPVWLSDRFEFLPNGIFRVGHLLDPLWSVLSGGPPEVTG